MLLHKCICAAPRICAHLYLEIASYCHNIGHEEAPLDLQIIHDIRFNAILEIKRAVALRRQFTFKKSSIKNRARDGRQHGEYSSRSYKLF